MPSNLAFRHEPRASTDNSGFHSQIVSDLLSDARPTLASKGVWEIIPGATPQGWDSRKASGFNTVPR